MCVCVCVCVAVWCSGCVLGSGPQVLRSPSLSPTLAFFSILIFHLPPTSPTNPSSCDWVPGICWGANSRPFLMNSNGPGGTSGAHTTCCEERPACMAHSACSVHRHPGSALAAAREFAFCICILCVCVCVCVCVTILITFN